MRAQRAGLICVILSLIGLGVSAYLEFVHIALLRGELIGGAACGAAGSVFNCHAVTASPYGALFTLPLSIWGLIAYLAALGLSIVAWQVPESSSNALATLAGLAFVFVAVDAALLIVMVTRIRLLCPMCLITYAVSLLLLGAAVWGAAKPLGELIGQIPSALGTWLPGSRGTPAWIVWGIVLTGAAGAYAVHASTLYMSQGQPGAMRRQMAQAIKQQKRVDVNTQGDPIEGRAGAPIQLVEFSDFLCPSCQRASQFTSIILAGRREDVSLVFKNFPLDQTCNPAISRQVHPNACQVAAAGECANEQGKFWAFHDRVFAQAKYEIANLERDAGAAGLDLTRFQECLRSGRGLEAVTRDIAEGARVGVGSTPTFVINGIPVTGALLPAQFDEFVETMRESARDR